MKYTRRRRGCCGVYWKYDCDSVGNSLNIPIDIDVKADSRLTLFGNIDDASAPLPAGVNKIGIGELVVAGTNSYRGTTTINQGVMTIENSQALGSTEGGTVVSLGASLQIQGSITVAGESLTLSGTGVSTVPSTVPIRWFANGPAVNLWTRTIFVVALYLHLQDLAPIVCWVPRPADAGSVPRGLPSASR